MLEPIIQAVREEGALMLQAHAIQVEEKTSAKDLVTNYDRLVQRHLEEKLRRLVPEAGFLGEEGLQKRASRQDGPYFVIDPIDGTMNFSRGYRRSCISVALARGACAELGVVYDPYLDELFSAQRGGGACLNGRPIGVSDRPLSRAIVMFGTTPYDRMRTEETFRLGRALFDRSLDLRRSGSAAIDLCAVAAGRAEVFYEWMLSPWDYAAAGLILEEAGGIVETVTGGTISMTEKSSVLAGNRAAFAEARQIAREVIR
ncbi:MAG: inositol monophosphatase family protein [Oscillospiraceae bacterium]|nr:inositol monophosphatase family protein [Oscillospiraceae bacterium]